jgi:hypothetical protein
MDDRTLSNLIRQATELEALLDAEAFPARGDAPLVTARRLSLRWGLAAAAALALAVILPMRDSSLLRPSADAWVFMDAPAPGIAPDGAADGADSFQRIRSCSDQDAYAIVLLREWLPECQCMDWRVHEFEGGAALMRLRAGQEIEIPVHVAGDPPLQQQLFLAIAPRLFGLPTSAQATEDLLACLTDAAPPTTADTDDPGGSGYTAVVQECFPPDVTILPSTFYAHR